MEGRNGDANESSGVFASIKNFFSINSLKVLYLYTIGSCIPVRCSTRCLPEQTDRSQTLKREESGTFHREPKLIIDDDNEVVGDERQKKEKVNLHFENHIQKWKRLHFPWKPIFHILLVALVTVQVGVNMGKHLVQAVSLCMPSIAQLVNYDNKSMLVQCVN